MNIFLFIINSSFNDFILNVFLLNIILEYILKIILDSFLNTLFNAFSIFILKDSEYLFKLKFFNILI